MIAEEVMKKMATIFKAVRMQIKASDTEMRIFLGKTKTRILQEFNDPMLKADPKQAATAINFALKNSKFDVVAVTLFVKNEEIGSPGYGRSIITFEIKEGVLTINYAAQVSNGKVKEYRPTDEYASDDLKGFFNG